MACIVAYYCPNCGAEMVEGSPFCNTCGATIAGKGKSVPHAPQPQVTPPQRPQHSVPNTPPPTAPSLPPAYAYTPPQQRYVPQVPTRQANNSTPIIIILAVLVLVCVGGIGALIASNSNSGDNTAASSDLGNTPVASQESNISASETNDSTVSSPPESTATNLSQDGSPKIDRFKAVSSRIGEEPYETVSFEYVASNVNRVTISQGGVEVSNDSRDGVVFNADKTVEVAVETSGDCKLVAYGADGSTDTKTVSVDMNPVTELALLCRKESLITMLGAAGDDDASSTAKRASQLFRSFTIEDLHRFKNAFFAFRGLRFQGGDLTEFFSQFPWYHPTTSDDSDIFDHQMTLNERDSAHRAGDLYEAMAKQFADKGKAWLDQTKLSEFTMDSMMKLMSEANLGN
ncbi:MAG: YARHG domain-containing protein [Armatimonadetes bacterium]|nr:YARHG domain-containing protein [Armatimonadota bacterium]